MAPVACMIRGLPGRLAPAAVLLLLAGCQAAAPPRAGETAAPDVEAPALPAEGAEAYRVVPGESEIRILVYRAGPLAKVGHNHVIRSTQLEGTVYRADDPTRSGFRVRVPVASLEVDPPAARRSEGGAFAEEISEEAARDTRRNMLGEKVLDAGRYPYIEVRSVALSGPSWNPEARMRVRIRDVSRDVTTPVAVTECGDRLVVVAEFSLRQSDFGITPYSALNGGLRVADVIRLRARVVAERK